MAAKFIDLTTELTVSIDEILRIEQKEIVQWDDGPSKFGVFVTLRSDREAPFPFVFVTQSEAIAFHSKLRKNLADHDALVDLHLDIPREGA